MDGELSNKLQHLNGENETRLQNDEADMIFQRTLFFVVGYIHFALL